ADGTAVVGASPELLVRRTGTKAFAQPMAASVARGANEADDERLAHQLEASTKDGVEHRLVADFVVDALRPFAEAVSARPSEVVRFTNIQHLATTVTADLSKPAADALELAAALHPTPAVEGWPRHAADQLIDQLEAMERDSRRWQAQADEFAKEFDVIRPDMRGFGDSELPPRPWKPREDLLALMDELRLKPAHLVGCSMGGSLAIDFVIDHPERVSKLVLVGAGIS